MDSHEAFGNEVQRLSNGRDLTPFDRSAIEAVAGLVLRIEEARRRIADEGLTVLDKDGVPKEHPAVGVEKRASQELRGWVKDRPDLFGEMKSSRPQSGGGFPGLAAVR